MNKENVSYLKDSLKYLGFGEKMQPELEQRMSEGQAEFRLQFDSTVNGKSFNAILNFRKADNSDMYFLNSYTAKLDRGIKENIEQTFYLNKGKGITGKEAFNLLDGRSVFKELTNKEGIAYHAWVQLDPNTKDKNGNHILKHYHTNYGYEMGKSLAALPVKELGNDEERMKLIKSLEKGNLQAVTFERNGKEERMFIEANPQYKTLNLYDGDMKRVRKDVTNEEKQTRSTKQEKSIDKNDTSKSVKKEAKLKTASKEKSKEDSNLLPKKRVGSKKGLSQ